MPWYKLPHTEHPMWFAHERADLEPTKKPSAKKPSAKAEPEPVATTEEAQAK